jgi:hypothetical protein
MFDVLAQATTEAIRWEDLGLSPSLFSIGSFSLRWYSLAYLSGIVLGWWHLTRMVKAPGSPMAARHADDLFFYCTLGIILGGRLGYAIFYRPELFGSIEILKLWEGGMSFHGGVIGTVIAIAWVAWRGQLSFLRVCDYISVNVGFGMLFGRIANFVNGELWGRPVQGDVPWAMIFPTDPLGLPRPSQPALRGAARRRAGDRDNAAAVLEDARPLPARIAGRRVHGADRQRAVRDRVLPRARREPRVDGDRHRPVARAVAQHSADTGRPRRDGLVAAAAPRWAPFPKPAEA